MDKVQIGEHALPVTVPVDLDDRLVAATGFGAAEHIGMLGPRSTPGYIARLLRPMLADDALAPIELAEMIAGADVLAVVFQVVDLLALAAAPKE